MRKAIKKLTLSRETIGNLNEGTLAGAVGMSTAIGCMTSGCATLAFPCRSNVQCQTVAYPCQTQTNCIGTQAC
jgi:hypothetical protein